MTEYTVTMIDTAGIQNYIFGSNNLQHNVGASWLVHCATNNWVFEELVELGKTNVDVNGLVDVYEELQTRLMNMLPPFARELLNEESFKRIMRLANPARFLEELDARFETLKEKVVPVRPEDISAELDESYDAVLALIDDLDLDLAQSLGQCHLGL